jgi:hypothetical protein
VVHSEMLGELQTLHDELLERHTLRSAVICAGIPHKVP